MNFAPRYTARVSPTFSLRSDSRNDRSAMYTTCKNIGTIAKGRPGATASCERRMRLMLHVPVLTTWYIKPIAQWKVIETKHGQQVSTIGLISGT